VLSLTSALAFRREVLDAIGPLDSDRMFGNNPVKTKLRRLLGRG